MTRQASITRMVPDTVSHSVLASSWLFTILWTVALAATGAWAWSHNKRQAVYIVEVFDGSRFYTRWFERLGASPDTVLTAGILAPIFVQSVFVR